MARIRTTFPNFDDLLLAWRNHLESGASPESCAGWKTRNGYISADGLTIYSYGEHYPLARRIVRADNGEYAYIINATGYSRTTAKHIREALNRLRPSIGYLGGSRRDLDSDTTPETSAQEWVASLVSASRAESATASRARLTSNKEWHSKRAAKLDSDARELAAWLGVSYIQAANSPPEKNVG